VTGAFRHGLFAPHEPHPNGWLPYYESDRMLVPTLDRMAREGAVFERFYMTSPMCTPSRYSLLTGRYASRARSLVEETPYISHFDDAPTPEGEPHWIAWNTYFHPSEPSIAREMAQLGYTTAFIGKWHNGQPDEVSPKFLYESYGDQPEVLQRKLREAQVKGGAFIREQLGFDVTDRLCFDNLDKLGGKNLPWYTEGVLDFISRSHDKPFFLYFAVPLPHGTAAAADYGRKVDPLLTPAGRLERAPEVQPSYDDIRRRIREAGASPRSVLTTRIDDMVAAIYARLEEEGLLEDTTVIFTTDHQSRGKSFFYESARVPFLATGPGITPGIRVRDLCANIDILPTLMALGGGKPRTQDVDGISFAENLKTSDPIHSGRALLLEAGYGRAVIRGDWKLGLNRPPQFDQVLADIERDQKYIEKHGGEPKVGWRGGSRDDAKNQRTNWLATRGVNLFPWLLAPDQLYNLREDPFEQFNRIDDPSCAYWAATLQSDLERITSTFNRPFDAQLR